MGNLVISPCYTEDADDVLRIFNHKSISPGLGGFTMQQTIQTQLLRPGNGKVVLIKACLDGECVGAMAVAGRPQAFRAKFGSVGVLPAHRRQRISSAMYAAVVLQGILEGRRLWEDSIVGNNDIQHAALPLMGLRRTGELRHRTGPCLGIVLYDFSLEGKEGLDDLQTMMHRAGSGPHNVTVQLLSNYYSDECFSANAGAYAKSAPHWVQKAENLKKSAVGGGLLPVRVTRDALHPTDTRRSTNPGFFKE